MPTSQELYALKQIDRNNSETAPVVKSLVSKVKEPVSATLTRTFGTTAYVAGASYGGRGVFTGVGSVGQSLFINDFQVIIDITTIPSGMSLAVVFYSKDEDSKVTGASVSDGSLITNTFPNACTPAEGYSLTLSVNKGKVFGVAKNIRFITPLEATSLWWYLEAKATFTSAANGETMTAKASCEVY
ncbi:MAG: hypothetical protein AN484_07020 [Aphanizomenon flos-aquae WA102]|uniref:Uncharacterized protein n=1 Tax=Aphanizomenon flos-aquae WA102 TaxID=1710896 RepID=A0A1B7X4X8_APHFL|nr:MAG: hypothetical protein AN484_07020 [Aphanizomenon flos-aquae WA102]